MLPQCFTEERAACQAHRTHQPHGMRQPPLIGLAADAVGLAVSRSEPIEAVILLPELKRLTPAFDREKAERHEADG